MYKQNHTTLGGLTVENLRKKRETQRKCLELHDLIESVFHEMRTAPTWSDQLLHRVEGELLQAVALIRSEHSEEETDPALPSEQARL